MVRKVKKVKAASIESENALASDVQHLFREAVTYRGLAGITPSLRLGYVREIMDGNEGFTELNPNAKPDKVCECGTDESCAICENELEDSCTVKQAMDCAATYSPFSGMASLLTTVKKYEFIALVENAYAQIGNKPFKLKPTKDVELSDEDVRKASKAFYDFLENFLEVNQVRVNEITTAFNFDTLGEVTDALADEAQSQAENRVSLALVQNETVLERVFKRAEFMQEYIQMIVDTTDYPIGVLWLDDKAIKRERKIVGGKMKINHQIQSDATRIDPCYFWVTEDHTLNTVGRAVFRLVQFTKADLMRWVEHSVTGSEKIDQIVMGFLDDNKDGSRIHEAMLFEDHRLLKKGLHDVLITRGQYSKDDVIALGVTIPDQFKNDQYIPCEIYFSGTNILRCRVMEVMDDHLGVYTTVFRRRGQSIFGWSLHDFIYPFAKLYEGLIDSVDTSTKKATGSIIMIDTGVASNLEHVLDKNEKTGEVTIDLSSDLVVEFDSTEAFMSNNFKGVPIHVEQLPNDVIKLLPVTDFVFRQLEIISGIPTILTSSQNIASALRTNSNFNASFAASGKTVQALLRGSETRVMQPSIQFFFDGKAMAGEFSDFLIELEPEILLSDTLTRERNDDQEMVTGVQQLVSIGGSLIPQDRLSRLVNTLGREVYRLEDDLIPNVGTLRTAQQATPVAGV